MIRFAELSVPLPHKQDNNTETNEQKTEIIFLADMEP